MPFNRPPRILPSPPTDLVVISGPANAPTKPGALNILSIGLPLGAVLLTVLLMSSGGGSGSSYIRFLPILLATYLATGVTYVVGRRNFKRELAEAKEEYGHSLTQVDERLGELQIEVRKALVAIDPSPESCLDRAQAKDPRLGERRPSDADFLALRIGIGEVEPTYEIQSSELDKTTSGFEDEFERARRIRDQYLSIPRAPIGTNLAAVGSIGIAGAADQAENLARSIVCQIATNHWPTEVHLAVVSSPQDSQKWQWIAELPHASRLIAGRPITAIDSSLSEWMSGLENELQQREQWLEAQSQNRAATNGKASTPLPRLIIVIADLPVDYRHPGLSLLLHRGKQLGVHAIFLAPKAELVPGQCGAVVLARNGGAFYREAGANGGKADCEADRFSDRDAVALAGALAAVDWPETDDISRPPDLVTVLDLLGTPDVSQLPIEEWWDGEAPFGYLKVPIGRQSATADLIFDLNDHDGSHGPHGLIGGMTGSGKSEVLKCILLGLAATHSPYDLNFALIDYKGGAAFNELVQLPHTVGIVTDIETHATYAERVIQALAGEIEYRKRVLERARAAFGFGRSHIDEYRELRVKRPLPRLVIVFDEFAEFKSRNPEESKRLISIARQGRSLGVHLILATQNIEAAVDPEILQNSTFRICLRVSQGQDSVQMIGIPDAVGLPRGRAYFRAQTRHLFQAGYSGGEYQQPEIGPNIREVVRVSNDGARESENLPAWGDIREISPNGDPGHYTEAQALVDRISASAKALRMRKPRPVWPDPLPDRLYLPEILSKNFQGGWDGTTWHECRPWRAKTQNGASPGPVLGMYDQPAEQRQVLLQLDPDQGSRHMLVFGSSGTGKSNLLRTLVASIARTQTPEDAQIYALDFGGQSALRVLEQFPHVGAVVTRLEEERVLRLLSYLQSEVSRRGDLLRKQGVDGYRDYNAKVGVRSRLPTIYFIIDSYGEFKRQIPIEVTRSVASLVGGGAAVGLHLIVSTSLQADVPNDLFANIAFRLTFYQADQAEYFRIIGKPSEAKTREDIENPPPPGRGLLRGTPPLEFQAALPGEGKTDEEQTTELSGLATEMDRAWKGNRPHPIGTLPHLVTLPKRSVRGKAHGDRAATSVLGFDYDTLSPIELDLQRDSPAFLVAAVSPQSGKTTSLRSTVLGLAESSSADELQFVFFDFHCRTMTPFRGLPHQHAYVGSSAGIDSTLDQLNQEIERRQSMVEKAYTKNPDTFDIDKLTSGWPKILVVIDDYDRYSERVTEARDELAKALTTGGEIGVRFLIAGNVSELPRDFDDPLIRAVRRNGEGILLSGTEGIEQFNNARRPQGQPASGLPAGRGYLVRRGQASLIQAAAYWSDGDDPEKALLERIERLEAGK
ncbi:MAG: FtsK/SpoIIIE domain-containing protein [Anaerolineales bacterium]